MPWFSSPLTWNSAYAPSKLYLTMYHAWKLVICQPHLSPKESRKLKLDLKFRFYTLKFIFCGIRCKRLKKFQALARFELATWRMLNVVRVIALSQVKDNWSRRKSHTILMSKNYSKSTDTWLLLRNRRQNHIVDFQFFNSFQH